MDKKYQPTTITALALSMASLVLSGCLGGSSSGSSGDTSPPFEGNLSGKLVAPNGESPIPNATVYIPDDQVGASSVQATGSAENGQCSEPDSNYVAWSCTDSEGNFSFDVDEEEGSTVTLNAFKGGWSMTQEISLDSASVGAINFSSNPDEGAAKIAVVTGSSDRIQDVLAKIGMGDLGEVELFSSGVSALGSGHHGHSHGGYTALSSDCSPGDYGWPEWPDGMSDDDIDAFCEFVDPDDIDYGDFDDGDFDGGDFGDFTFTGLELGTETFSLYDGDGSLPDDYDNVDALFTSTDGNDAPIFDYDIVYVNCSARNPQTTDWANIAEEYVAQGGVLYVTDLSADYVVQPFSGYLQRKTTGEQTDSVPGEILDESLADWLSGVSCANGSCIAGDNTFELTGLAGGWELLKPLDDSVEALVSADVADVVYDNSLSEDVQPMTMRFNYNRGLVIYSSYHTSDFLDGSGSDFIAQERVLEYLFYENVD